MKKVLVVGAGDYQIPMIKRLKEMGHFVYAIDGRDTAPGLSFADESRVIDVLDKDACLAYAEERGIDAVMTYGATITLPTVAYIGSRMGLRTISERAADISTDKFKIKQCLARAGVNTFGEFALIDGDNTDKSAIKLPCVIKPCDGSGSKGVSVVHKYEELDAAIEYARDSARFGEFYWESFIKGEEYGVELFCDGENYYVYAIAKIPFIRRADGLDYGHIVPSGLPCEIEERICEQVIAAAKALDVNMGSVNFDIILSEDDNTPYIIDLGIRVGQNLIASHIVPLSRGVNELDQVIEMSLGERVDARPKCKKCISTRLLIYSPGIIREIKDYSALIGHNGVIDVVLRKGVGEEVRPYSVKSDSCGWVIAQGESHEEASLNACRARDALKDYIVIS